MEEKEILKKLNKYENIISQLLDALDTEKDNVKILKSENEELCSTNNELNIKIKDLQESQVLLKEKTYKTIKHLVEDVIEKQQIEIEEKEEQFRRAIGKRSEQENESSRKVQFEQDKDITVQYKFGVAKKSFGDKFKLFINEICPIKPGKFTNELRIISMKLDLPMRVALVFVDYLEKVKINNIPLVEEIGGNYYTKFTKDEILEAMF